MAATAAIARKAPRLLPTRAAKLAAYTKKTNAPGFRGTSTAPSSTWKATMRSASRPLTQNPRKYESRNSDTASAASAASCTPSSPERQRISGCATKLPR
jgi:hypothetical protein